MIMCVFSIANKMTNNALSEKKIGGFYPILDVVCICDDLFISPADRTFFVFVSKYVYLET